MVANQFAFRHSSRNRPLKLSGLTRVVSGLYGHHQTSVVSERVIVSTNLIDGSAAVQKISKQDLAVETLSRLAHLVSVSERGSRLPTERELCEMLGVGRSTLREAIRSLEFIGAIQVRQGSGTFVTEAAESRVEKLIAIGLVVDRSTVADVVEFRRMLEVQAVRLAAERYLPEDREALEEITSRFAASLDRPAEASRHDLEFHVLLAKASHNSVLSQFANGIRPLLEIWITHAVNRPDVTQAVRTEHEEILRAVLDRDPDTAAARMFIHQSNAAGRLYAVLGRDHSTGSYLSALMSDSQGPART